MISHALHHKGRPCRASKPQKPSLHGSSVLAHDVRARRDTCYAFLSVYVHRYVHLHVNSVDDHLHNTDHRIQAYIRYVYPHDGGKIHDQGERPQAHASPCVYDRPLTQHQNLFHHILNPFGAPNHCSSFFQLQIARFGNGVYHGVQELLRVRFGNGFYHDEQEHLLAHFGNGAYHDVQEQVNVTRSYAHVSHDHGDGVTLSNRRLYVLGRECRGRRPHNHL